jgi:hypothetical protein
MQQHCCPCCQRRHLEGPTRGGLLLGGVSGKGGGAQQCLDPANKALTKIGSTWKERSMVTWMNHACNVKKELCARQYTTRSLHK